MSSLAPPLTVEGLTQRLRRRTVLRGCTFAVPGGTTALLGPNGAGKTVLLRTLAGVTPAVTGRVWLGGGDAARPADLLREVAYVPRSPGVHPHLSVRDHLERTARWHRVAGPRGSAEQAAERMGLARWMHVAAGHLGPVERHRLALAEAWLRRARIVLLDEPTADLDPEQRAAFWSHVAALPAEAVVVTTHHFDEVQAHCRAAVVLQGGRVRFSGAVAELAATAEGCCFLLPAGAVAPPGSVVVGMAAAGVEVLAAEPLAAPARIPGPLDGYLQVLGVAAAVGLAAVATEGGWPGAGEPATAESVAAGTQEAAAGWDGDGPAVGAGAAASDTAEPDRRGRVPPPGSIAAASNAAGPVWRGRVAPPGTTAAASDATEPARRGRVQPPGTTAAASDAAESVRRGRVPPPGTTAAASDATERARRGRVPPPGTTAAASEIAERAWRGGSAAPGAASGATEPADAGRRFRAAEAAAAGVDDPSEPGRQRPASSPARDAGGPNPGTAAWLAPDLASPEPEAAPAAPAAAQPARPPSHDGAVAGRAEPPAAGPPPGPGRRRPRRRTEPPS